MAARAKRRATGKRKQQKLRQTGSAEPFAGIILSFEVPDAPSLNSRLLDLIAAWRKEDPPRALMSATSLAGIRRALCSPAGIRWSSNCWITFGSP
jgi:hypothetical protein